MADADQENGMMEVGTTHTLDTHTAIVVQGQIQETESEEVTEDILQQALEEASNSFDGGTVEYAQSDAISAGSVVVGQEIVNSVATLSGVVQQAGDGAQHNYETSNFEVVATLADGVNVASTLSSSDIVGANEEGTIIDPGQNEVLTTSGAQPGLTVTLLPANKESGAPLGSSQNPIRIIQQGNQYTPLQNLTADQLQQIMQVVQQQQLAKSTQAEGSSILYNPQTNTRIVYRVIYPSELNKSGNTVLHARVETQSQGQQTVMFNQIHKRGYRRRHKEEEEKLDGPELSREEKEERKKHRPRTRSGRVSKPPKHMVKDYKHIHVLDWDEDYDDSDGGYSDFKYSEDEEAARERNRDGPYIHPGRYALLYSGLGSSKPKNFKCETCNKAYIGRAGLGRHFRLNPDHGQLPDEDLELLNQSEMEGTNGLNSSGNFSEDSNTQDSLIGQTTPVVSRTANHFQRTGFRGRYAHLHESPVKRKARLRELVRQCEDEELMEIVLPRLAKVITLWEFLLMKVEKGRPLRPHVDDIFKEYETLHKQVQRICQEYLRPILEDDNRAESLSPNNRLQIQNTPVALALGLNVGTFEVKDIPIHDENTFQYKLLTTDPSNLHVAPSQTGKRTVEVVTHDQLVSQPAHKRPRLITITTADLSELSSSQNSMISFQASAETQTTGMTNGQQAENNAQTAVNTIGSGNVVSENHVGMSEQKNDSTLLEPPANTSQNVIVSQPSIVNGSSTEQEKAEKTVSCQEEMINADILATTTTMEMPTTTTSTTATTTRTAQTPVMEETTVPMVITQQHPQVAVPTSIISQDLPSSGEVDLKEEIASASLDQAELDSTGQIIFEDQIEGHIITPEQLITNCNIFQSPDGIIVIQKPDGSTVQYESGQSISLETVQALLAIETQGHLEAGDEQ